MGTFVAGVPARPIKTIWLRGLWHAPSEAFVGERVSSGVRRQQVLVLLKT